MTIQEAIAFLNPTPPGDFSDEPRFSSYSPSKRDTAELNRLKVNADRLGTDAARVAYEQAAERVRKSVYDRWQQDITTYRFRKQRQVPYTTPPATAVAQVAAGAPAPAPAPTWQSPARELPADYLSRIGPEPKIEDFPLPDVSALNSARARYETTNRRLADIASGRVRVGVAERERAIAEAKAALDDYTQIQNTTLSSRADQWGAAHKAWRDKAAAFRQPDFGPPDIRQQSEIAQPVPQVTTVPPPPPEAITLRRGWTPGPTRAVEPGSQFMYDRPIAETPAAAAVAPRAEQPESAFSYIRRSPVWQSPLATGIARRAELAGELVGTGAGVAMENIVEPLARARVPAYGAAARWIPAAYEYARDFAVPLLRDRAIPVAVRGIEDIAGAASRYGQQAANWIGRNVLPPPLERPQHLEEVETYPSGTWYLNPQTGETERKP